MMRIPIALLAFFTLTSLAQAEEMAPDEVNRRLLKIESHPCFGERGLQRSICMMKLRRGTPKPKEEGGAIGRRQQALLQRQKEQRSHLVPRWMTTPGRIDLRPTAEQIQEDPAKSRKIVPKGNVTTPLLRVRVRAGTRKDPVALPLCTRRHGLALVACLQELRIEVSPDTVDPETWERYLDTQEESEDQ